MVLIHVNGVLFAGLLVLVQELNPEQDDVVEVVRCVLREAQRLRESVDSLVLQVEWLGGVIWVLDVGLQCREVGFEVLGDRVVVVAVRKR